MINLKAEDQREWVLMHAVTVHGAWVSVPRSKRHDPELWEACKYLVREKLVIPTDDVRGDKTGFRATERGRVVCTVMMALRRPSTKPCFRVMATANESAQTADPVPPPSGGTF